MKARNLSRLAAPLLGLTVIGLTGCANQNAPVSYSQGMDVPTQPLAVDPQLAGQAGGSGAGNQSAVPNQIQADPWPRQVALANATAEIYLPQVNSWSGNTLSFRAAVSVKASGAKEEIFGVIFGTARTHVDALSRTVALNELVLTQAKFPTLPDNGLAYLQQLRAQSPAAMATMSLDLLAGELAASQTVKPKAIQVDNTPPGSGSHPPRWPGTAVGPWVSAGRAS